MTGTEALTRALERRLAALLAEPPAVAMGMTYGNPSIAHALERLQAAGVRRLVVLPLYPQYSTTTTAAALDRVDAALARWPVQPERLVIEDYHDDPAHIAALAASIQAARAPFDHLLFSFHGIPARYAAAGDPYGERCHATARLVAAHLGLPQARWSIAFQSRVGRARWLEPYTEDRLRELGTTGVERLAVVCPGFAVDCLETLEEIAIRGSETFLAAGGIDFEYLPALNDDAAQVDCLARLVLARLGTGSAA
jgi:ferrochelatase